jgi:hypothetical protein
MKTFIPYETLFSQMSPWGLIHVSITIMLVLVKYY